MLCVKDLDLVSRDAGITTAKLSEWREHFLAAWRAGRPEEPGSGRAEWWADAAKGFGQACQVICVTDSVIMMSAPDFPTIGGVHFLAFRYIPRLNTLRIASRECWKYWIIQRISGQITLLRRQVHTNHGNHERFRGNPGELLEFHP